jgi:hypothetical protein
MCHLLGTMRCAGLLWRLAASRDPNRSYHSTTCHQSPLNEQVLGQRAGHREHTSPEGKIEQQVMGGRGYVRLLSNTHLWHTVQRQNAISLA